MLPVTNPVPLIKCPSPHDGPTCRPSSDRMFERIRRPTGREAACLVGDFVPRPIMEMNQPAAAGPSSGMLAKTRDSLDATRPRRADQFDHHERKRP